MVKMDLAGREFDATRDMKPWSMVIDRHSGRFGINILHIRTSKSAFSPDSDRVACLDGDDFMIIDTLDLSSKTIAGSVSNFAWAPTGNRLGFVSNIDGNPVLYIREDDSILKISNENESVTHLA